MNNQDPIADMLTRIRNANRVGRRMVLIPKSKICTGIAQVLQEEGYIESFDVIDDSRQGQIRVQAQLRGHPLVGERRYGGRGPASRDPIAFDRQALHAFRLAFAHPADRRQIEVTAPPPADFTALLDRLRRRR